MSMGMASVDNVHGEVRGGVMVKMKLGRGKCMGEREIEKIGEKVKKLGLFFIFKKKLIPMFFASPYV